ncbi:tetratricopeptide repeat protein [Lacticaseibacillus brantae]|uniref:TPR repeat-containing protein n=1 Tax=Lacticaseibacillus brantae DSM 23927 TaxID=1423727 RepID=A0A0R2B1C4_9LACO|nr:tetratricopeptide repeat protein [Lacticaseibacillus brantae]KRM72562.1 hypothetical protein FC34_GL000269 [Lacticaseibacillus brantae DSM 23927]
MGDVVAFPGNADRHLSVGQQALAAKDYASAVAHLDKAYEASPDFDHAKVLVEALVGLNAASEALPYIGRYIEDFLKQPKDRDLMLSTLLAVPDYRSAWAVTHYFAREDRAAAEQTISAAEQADLAKNETAIETLRKQLSHMGGLAFHEQEALMSQLGRLPKSVALQAIPPVLADGDVHPAIRVSMLDALTAVGDSAAVTFLSYNGNRSVVPDDLPGVLNDPAIQKMVHLASRQINDPDEREATLEMLRLQLGFLYPFVGESISDQDGFVAAFVAHQPSPEPEVAAWLETQIAALVNQA